MSRHRNQREADATLLTLLEEWPREGATPDTLCHLEKLVHLGERGYAPDVERVLSQLREDT